MSSTDEFLDVDIRYTGVGVRVKLPDGKASALPTVAEALWGIVSSLPRAAARCARRSGPAQSEFVHLLDNVSGVILPGRMTLLLGAPGSGKSTLLKALTGRLANQRSMTGSVRYCGLTSTEARARGIAVNQIVQYVSQLDEHSALLTVRETLDFIARNSFAGAASNATYASARVQEVLDLLHLNGCADTRVGDDLTRGISGGEKKRLTIGEGLLTNARFLALDEVSTGLDASVTQQIFGSLRERVLERRMGVVAALLQPSPELVALFDDVILLRDGCVVYHGPRLELPGYLRGLGFLPPASWTPSPMIARGTAEEAEPAIPDLNAADLADWISEWVTYPLRRHRKDLVRQPAGATVAASAASPPVTTDALVRAWTTNPLYAALLASPPQSTGSVLPLDSLVDHPLFSRRHAHHPLVHLGLVARRQVLLLLRAWDHLLFRVVTALVMGTLIGALYFQSGVERGLNYYGLFLNTIMLLSFFNLPEMSPTMALKFIAYRQVDDGCYPGWTFPAAGFLVQLPLAFAETLLFATPVYFMAGLTAEASRYCIFIAVAFLGHVFTAATFRIFAYISPTLDLAQTAPMSAIAILVLFAGFFVVPTKMGWSLPIYYIDAYGYACKALALNEFLAPRYDFIPSSGGDETLGHVYLKEFGLPTETRSLALSFAFLVVYGAILIAVSVVAFLRVRFDRNIGSARTVDGDSDSADPSVASPSSKALSGLALSLPAPTEASPLFSKHAPQSASIAVAPATAALPFEPTTLTFQNLTYTVRLRRVLGAPAVERRLLQGIRGFAEPGRMLALMGASGAGKTTLLDVLAGRKNSGKMTGAVLVNGRPRDPATFNRSAAYCEQSDMHMPLATVREAFDDAAALRLERGVSKAARRAFVDELLGLLEMQHLADRKVGDFGAVDGLAPGERKRLTVGVELCANTPVLFLDEPTSGLDARAAAVVLRVLRRVARTGRTVICTIHQPSFELFAQFDDLLLLQRGGFQVYFGPLGPGCRSIVEYLEAFPTVPRCPPGGNPASWMLDVLASACPPPKAVAASAASAEAIAALSPLVVDTEDLPEGRNGALPSGGEFHAAYFASARWLTGRPSLEARLAELSAQPVESGTLLKSSGARLTLGWPAQYAALAAREWRSAYRDIPYNMGRILALIGLQVFYGIVYVGISSKATDIAGLQSLVSAIFNTTAYAGFVHLNLGLPVAVRVRAVFYRETSALIYSPWVYFFALMTAEIPWLALSLLTGPVASYFLIGLNASAAIFATNYLVLFLLSFVFVLVAKTASHTLPTFELAQSVTGVIMPVMMDFSGLYGKVSAMPPEARWINRVDPLAYALNALLPLHLTCDGGAAAGCPTIVYPQPGVGPVPVDRTALVDELYDVSYSRLWQSVGVLGVFAAALLITTALSMGLVRHITR